MKKDLEIAFLYLKGIVSPEKLLNYTYWTIPLTIQTYDSDKQLGTVISQKNKPIEFFSQRL